MPDTTASNPNLKRARCPRCGNEFTYASVAAHKSFPFCSPRCRDVDLGNWITGRYLIPGRDGSVLPPDDENMAPERDAT